MRVLLTGASGFVGSHLANRLLEAGHEVLALTRDPSSLPKGCTPLLHELGSGPVSQTASNYPKALDAVVNLAQSRVYRNFPADAETMFRVNVAGTQEVLDLAAATGASAFCQISTGTVYEPFAEPLLEDKALSPKSALGATKLAAEVIAKPYGTLFALSTLRLFAPYGPGQEQRLVPEIIRRVTSGEAVDLPTDSSGMTFSLAHVDDVCRVIETAIDEKWERTLNVASPEVMTIEDVARTIGHATGQEPIFNRKEMGAPRIVPDLAALSEIYDMSRFRNFATGVADMLASGNGIESTSP